MATNKKSYDELSVSEKIEAKKKKINMSRIVGAVFAQTFCNSRGGGDY